MGAHRRARSARAAARVALCVVALLAAASGASAVSLSETDKRAAHESHHARKARLREELAAAELATREKYEAKVSSLERTTERLRREAEDTVASLSAERDAMSRNLTKYKRGLLNLDAKRKSETETLRAETERLRAEREELQAKLEQALDDALSATKAAADAKRESRAIARAAKTEGASAATKRNVDETSTSDARTTSSAAIGRAVAGVAETVSGALARAAHLATRAGHALRPRNALRVIAAVARDLGWLPLAASATDDDAAACLAAVVAAAALGALAAKGAAAAERLARGASWVSARASDGSGFWDSLGAGRVGRRTRTPPAFPSDAYEGEAPRSASDSDEYELVDDDASNPSLPDSPTRAAADAARSFDAAPEAFERSMRSSGSERENLVGVSARVAALEASAARGEVSPGEGSPGLEPDAGFFAFASSGASPPPPLGDSEPPLGDSEPPLGDSPSAAFETPAARAARATRREAKSRETPVSKSDWPASSPPIRDGALKSALRRLAEALATPKTARAGHGGTPDPARTSARAPETPASRRAEKTNVAYVDDVDDDDAANRKKSAAETARAAVETPPAFEPHPGEPHPGSRRRLERAHQPSPASVTKKSPANVTSASLVRTPAPAPAGGRTPGSGDSASSADRGGGASSLSSLGPAPTRARAPVTPRDRMVAYSQKLRRGVPVEIPALDARVSPWGGDAVVAGGVRHPRGWAS
jgi:hypothetical protein